MPIFRELNHLTICIVWHLIKQPFSEQIIRYEERCVKGGLEMLHELKPDQFKKVLPIFKEQSYHVAIESIVRGNTLGRVFVDELENPGAALVWNTLDTLILEGNTLDSGLQQALNQLIWEELLPDAQSRYVPCFSLYAASDVELNIQSILEGMPFMEIGRRVYVFDRLEYRWQDEISAHLSMVRITQELLQDEKLENYGQMRGWVESFWPSHTEFMNKGIGYCVIDRNTIAGWCLSVYVAGDRYELGLATIESYRNQGVAKMTASACIQYCLENQLTPVWQCNADNIPSNLVAEKVGFKNDRDYSGYLIDFQKITK